MTLYIIHYSVVVVNDRLYTSFRLRDRKFLQALWNSGAHKLWAYDLIFYSDHSKFIYLIY